MSHPAVCTFRTIRIAVLLCGPAIYVEAQGTIPIRTVKITAETDSGALWSVTGMRSISGGRVLVNDFKRRRLVAFDSTLATYTIVMDSSVGATHPYGLRQRMLIPSRGDSTLIPDPESATLVTINAVGMIDRSIAPPKASDLPYLALAYYGTSAIDPEGRLIYRTFRRDPPRPAKAVGDSGTVTYEYGSDSAPILRGDFERRTVDTIAMIRIPVQKQMTIVLDSRGRVTSVGLFNPMPITDEWVLLPDGVIAIVRSQDYHIDWVYPDGTLMVSAKMPFAWERFKEDDKRRMLDSVTQVVEAALAKAPPPPLPLPGQPQPPPFKFKTVDPVDLPDYYPPIRVGQVMADLEGNVWILPTTSVSAGGGLVWDVVNRAGELFERVRLPIGRNLAGFGVGGVTYLSNQSNGALARLERAYVVR